MDEKGRKQNTVVGSRIVFEFCHHPHKARTSWAKVNAFFAESGAWLVSEPTGEPPYLLVVVLPQNSAVKPFLEHLRQLEDVGQADVDALREAF